MSNESTRKPQKAPRIARLRRTVGSVVEVSTPAAVLMVVLSDDEALVGFDARKPTTAGGCRAAPGGGPFAPHGHSGDDRPDARAPAPAGHMRDGECVGPGSAAQNSVV